MPIPQRLYPEPPCTPTGDYPETPTIPYHPPRDCLGRLPPPPLQPKPAAADTVHRHCHGRPHTHTSTAPILMTRPCAHPAPSPAPLSSVTTTIWRRPLARPASAHAPPPHTRLASPHAPRLPIRPASPCDILQDRGRAHHDRQVRCGRARFRRRGIHEDARDLCDGMPQRPGCGNGEGAACAGLDIGTN